MATYYDVYNTLSFLAPTPDYAAVRRAYTLQLTRFWIPEAFRPNRPPAPTGRWVFTDDEIKLNARREAEAMVEAILAVECPTPDELLRLYPDMDWTGYRRKDGTS